MPGCGTASSPLGGGRQTDRQAGTHTGRVTEKQARLPCCSASPDMHQCHSEGCDSRQLSCFPAPQAGAVPTPRAFVSISAQASATIARDKFQSRLRWRTQVQRQHQHCPLPPMSHRSLPCVLRAWDKHSKTRTVTPVPVAQSTNAPRALPLAAIPCTRTARPLCICFPTAGSQRLRAPSGCVHFDTKSRRVQVRDCKYLACCSSFIAGSWDQVFSCNGTVALQDRTVMTLQHT